MRKVPVLDDRSVSQLCILLLDRLKINLALCTDHDEVLYATKRTKEILRRFADGTRFRTGHVLPEAVRAATRAYLRQRDELPHPRRLLPVKLTTPDGRTHVYVSCTPVDGAPPVASVVRLRDEMINLRDVLDAMGRRYRLSARDRRLIRSVAELRTVREIAAVNALTYGTTKVYLHDLYRRVDVHSRDGLLRLIDRVRRG